jgi:hypothetical protein
MYTLAPMIDRAAAAKSISVSVIGIKCVNRVAARSAGAGLRPAWGRERQAHSS